MKILLVSEAKSIHTKRWAQSFKDEGHEVHVASFRAADVPGATLHILPTYGLGRLGYFLAAPSLRRLAKKLKPDIVHAQYVTSYGFISALAHLRPLVITAWGTDILISPRKSRLMKSFVKYALSHCDAITTVAQHMNNAITELGNTGLPIETTPFGVDTQRFKPPEEPRKEASILKLICTRNFAPIYSVHTVIEAIGLLKKQNVFLRVDLVGEGPLRPELEALVADLKLQEQISFRGHVNHETLARLLSEADIFVTPALSDGNNISLNEAMACACFPIATDIPANSQWIEHGKNGYLYPSGNSQRLAEDILKAIQNKALRDQAATINLEIVKTRADWRLCVEKMKKIYARAMARSQHG